MAETGRNSRITAFKNVGQGSNELRRKRAELSVTLRKQARDEQLLKRRAVSPEASLEEQQTEAETLPNPAEIVLGLKTSNLQLQLSCARAARRILSREQSPPISQLVEAGVIKPLVEALDRDDCSDLQFEAAWALTNIASGTQAHTLAVVKSGAIPRLVALVGRGGSVAEQCIWALGNVAGDGAATRDVVLQHGALPAMLSALSPHAPTALLRTAAWTYSNFCRNKNPLVRFELVSPALPHVSELLGISDHDVLADTCWALSYLTDGPDERIERVQLTPGLLERLVPLLAHPSPAVRTPSLRALGNMLTGSDVQTQRCLDAGCLGHIMSLLRCGKAALIKEAAWAASNILAGSQQQIQQAIDAGLLPKLVEVLETEEVKCQKEAAWAITNLCLGGAAPQLEALLRAGFLRPFCALLGAADARAALVALDGLANLLQAAVKYGELDALCLQIEEVGALDLIEALQKHDNEEVYQKAVKILDAYFSDGGEPESPAVVGDELCLSVSAPADQQFNF